MDSDTEPERLADLGHHLATVPNPRDPRGDRHGLASILALAAAAVAAGTHCLTAIGEWAADAPQHVLAALGMGPRRHLPRRHLPNPHPHPAPRPPLRNLTISALRLTGHHNIAKALRHMARDTTRPLRLLGITP
ncbi:MAG TPA: transposase family protein [Actinophytocola sp.]|jgi:hypothetical protein|nr:transposase family protein [Actinophytocola sp.]